MAQQTNYNYFRQQPFVEGKIADTVPFVTRTMLNQTGLVIPMGAALIWDGTKIALPTAALSGGQFFAGVAADRDLYEYVADGDGRPSYPAGVINFELMEKGDMTVYLEDAATASLYAPVYFRHTAGAGGTVLQRFRSVDEAGNVELVANSMIVDIDIPTNLAIVNFNIP